MNDFTLYTFFTDRSLAENNLTELRDNVHNASLYFIDYNFLFYWN